MPNLGTTEIIIIALVILVLFGSKRLPDAARSFGRSLRIFKAETKGLRDDDTGARNGGVTGHSAESTAASRPASGPLPIEAPRPTVEPTESAPSVNGSSPVDAERR